MEPKRPRLSKGLSSLDVAREAASSIAVSYIRAGDRVGFQDLSSRSRMIAHAGGDRHLWRLLRAIETTGPSSVPFRHQRPPIVPPGALVYLLSSLLDDQAMALALSWRGSGHRVIAVDVLPPAGFARTTRYERAAYRMVMMERDDRIRILRERGVELLRWPEGDTPARREVRLALLSRPQPLRGSTAMNRLRVSPPDDLPVSGAWIPGYTVRVAFVIAGVLLTLVDFGVTGWIVLGFALIVGATWSPQQLYGWALILFLAAGQLGRHEHLSWRFLVLLAGIHLLYVLAMLAPAVPLRSWVQPAVFVAPLTRFVAIQIPTQILAVVALLLLAPDTEGHHPLTIAAFAAIGVVGLAGLGLLLLGSRSPADA